MNEERQLDIDQEHRSSSPMYQALNMPLQIKDSEIDRSYATQIRTNSAAAGPIASEKGRQLAFSDPDADGGADAKERPINECDDASSQVHSVQHTSQNING